MPELKTRMLFISHAWKYDQAYLTLVSWFNEANNFSWKNCSIPSTDALPDKSTSALAAGITRQINPAQGVLIIAGMYAAHSGWIDYEIGEAQRLGKTIIGIRPWGQERMPVKVQEAAHALVNWNSASVIEAVRNYI
ncbi:TIR domain-containing protein [Rhodoferax sp.]|uniref:TIR domain-containing protein n=1 Tax=Rhodoferax sp. TaxID=50421 RepID=UPI002614C638|nr:TIR domain-containing protein [Rhodoferax sp.]MDD2809051.1 TIR domain-containing protein [Rhodoferax sp.]MDD4943328.1 TIR domain-containing protein [Rhodoferax sp.]